MARAARSSGQSGVICFDDPTASGRWRGEWTAGNPDRVVTGCLPREAPPVPMDGEFWAGTVDYDGQWRFARYPVFAHRSGIGESWAWHGKSSAGRGVPGLDDGLKDFPAARLVEGGLERLAFTKMVRRAKEYIAAGDIYQVNLSHRFRAAWPVPPPALDLAARLRAVSPAPHSAFLDQGDRVVLSASPETFLDRKGDVLVTRPIKGTRPRGVDTMADTLLRDELLASEKERAELVMITDLERNDLGQVARTGSIRVDGICALETFPQVHHLVSTVSARLRPDTGWPEIWRATFPGGSITGAPKKRALEIIHELEPLPRGLYTGAIGWMLGPDNGCFSIAIRTAILTGNELLFHAGAGIVEGSDPDAEFDETHHKASGLARAFGLQ